jgi:hypothetical protein
MTDHTQIMYDLLHVESGLAEVRDPSGVRALVLDLREKRAGITADERLSEEGKREELAKLADEAKAAASSYRSAIQAKLDAARKTAAAARDLHRPGPEDDRIPYELQLTRAHNRVQRQLDAGVSPDELARRAAQDGDVVMFDAIEQLAPAHMRANGAQPKVIDAVTQLVDQAKTPLLSEAEAKGRQVAAQVEQLAYFSNMNLQGLEAEVSGGGALNQFVADRDRVIDVETGSILGRDGRVVAGVTS